MLTVQAAAASAPGQLHPGGNSLPPPGGLGVSLTVPWLAKEVDSWPGSTPRQPRLPPLPPPPRLLPSPLLLPRSRPGRPPRMFKA